MQDSIRNIVETNDANQASAARIVTSSKRFSKDYENFCQKYSHVAKTLRDFIRFRLTARPDQPFNTKDSRLQSGVNCSRCHLVLGKAILLYRIQKSEIQLLAITEHDGIEYRTTSWLRDLIATQSFTPYTQPEIIEVLPGKAPSKKKPAKRVARSGFDLSLFSADARETRDRIVMDTERDDQDVLDPEFRVGRAFNVSKFGVKNFVSEREAWRLAVINMRIAGQEWATIHTTMRRRLRDDFMFRASVLDRYSRTSKEDREKLRYNLRNLKAIKAARDEDVRNDLASYETEVRNRLTKHPPEDIVVSGKAEAQPSSPLETAQKRIIELEALLESEQSVASRVRRIEQENRQANSLVTELRTAKNIVSLARDQAEEALESEREHGRKMMANMREMELALQDERSRCLRLQPEIDQTRSTIVLQHEIEKADMHDAEMIKLRDERDTLKVQLQSALTVQAQLEGRLRKALSEIDRLAGSDAMLDAAETEATSLETLGARIERLRQGMKMSQAQLAHAIGKSAVLIGHFEHDRTKPNATMLAGLASALNVSNNYLLHGVDSVAPLPTSEFARIATQYVDIVAHDRKRNG